MPKTIFITGSSSGVGKETAILFAEKGWNVIATMRNPQSHNDFENYKNISVLALDITRPDQINNTIFGLLEKTAVDVLYNNAGYGLIGPFEASTDEQIFQQINTNLIGTMRVTKAFIPHFRERKTGTIINATSIAGHVAFPLFCSYHGSKWGIEGWSESLAYELEQFGVKVKIVVPGRINTDFDERSLVITRHEAYEPIVGKVEAVYNHPRRLKNQSTALGVARVVYKAATDGRNKLRYIAGRDAISIFWLRRILGHKLFIKVVQWVFLRK
jgi:short-subunit dehydrogenase